MTNFTIVRRDLIQFVEIFHIARTLSQDPHITRHRWPGKKGVYRLNGVCGPASRSNRSAALSSAKDIKNCKGAGRTAKGLSTTIYDEFQMLKNGLLGAYFGHLCPT